MSEEHINMLNSSISGFRCTAQYDDKSWKNQLEALKVYKSKHGHCNVPSKNKQNQSLGFWVEYQRSQYKLSKLSEERMNMLNAIGFDWTAPRDSAWSNNFDLLKLYKAKYGDCNVPLRYKENQSLGTWVYTQRSQYKQSKVSDERIARLNSIGFVWTVVPKNIIGWSDKFEELKLYKSKHGDCNVLNDDKNKPLANWVYKQRSKYKHLKLSDEKIAMLNGISFDWSAQSRDNAWSNTFDQLKKYKSKHGDCNVPSRYKENQPLGTWVYFQRSQYTNSKISEEHINMLNSIGFDWTTPYDKCWKNQLEALKVYKSKHGHYDVSSKNKQNQSLGSWVEKQRSQYKLSKLSEERMNMLKAIGFNWTAPRDSAWSNNFDQLKLYKAKYGDFNVPLRYKENQSLGTWVYTQRSQYKQSKVSDERIARLNSIGFVWTTAVPKDIICWSGKFEELKLYKSKHGDCNVLNDDENKPLANWVYKQRSQYKHLKLSDEKIAMLNGIGFDWSAQTSDSVWSDKFKQLKKYKFKHGDCNVPARYKENQPLTTWVQRQRSQYTNSKISEEHINMLNSIGFNWTVNIKLHDKIEAPKKYKLKHGDCKVPAKHDGNQPLDNMLKGHSTPLTKERIELLDSIGFVSSMRQPKSNVKSEKNRRIEHAIGNDIDTEQEESEAEQNNEEIVTYDYVSPIRIERGLKRPNFEHAVGNDIDTEQEDDHKHIAMDTRSRDSKEKVATTKEKVDESCKRSLQDRIQVLCKLSIMFQQEKEAIYADMKRRKLDSSV